MKKHLVAFLSMIGLAGAGAPTQAQVIKGKDAKTNVKNESKIKLEKQKTEQKNAATGGHFPKTAKADLQHKDAKANLQDKSVKIDMHVKDAKTAANMKSTKSAAEYKENKNQATIKLTNAKSQTKTTQQK